MLGLPQNSGGVRNQGIDLFRGVLILLVILGHFAELTTPHTFLTWMGFGFRMPLFIGMTGYLFNLEHARSMTLPALTERYYRRLVLPWLIACLIYIVLSEPLTWAMPLRIVLRPPFHLWFVPVMLAFILASWACSLRPGQMLAIAAPVSIAAMYVFGVGHEIEQYRPWIPDRRYFIYPIYFMFGLWIARRPLYPEKLPFAIVLALIGCVWWALLFDRPSPAAEVAAELLLCLPLIRMLPLVRLIPPSLPLIAGVGRDSLFFYLWHPLVLGLWASAGLAGAPMLAVSLLSLGLAWAMIVRMPLLRPIVGICPPARTRRTEDAAIQGEIVTAGTT
ncbi:acyltransferase [Sphingomonas sp. BIUV-7]|uniref:Acyltransferase n=1 Tax=Sphingomonas natans TaxID=3063330 RepID=A0ABT8YFH2_9SPHN|nr:acyltransferase [Sphingomonas sp. BIUV-7]MDO6416772.1 acyltransferase [Sphingomonas sp. BIUV-7]